MLRRVEERDELDQLFGPLGTGDGEGLAAEDLAVVHDDLVGEDLAGEAGHALGVVEEALGGGVRESALARTGAAVACLLLTTLVTVWWILALSRRYCCTSYVDAMAVDELDAVSECAERRSQLSSLMGRQHVYSFVEGKRGGTGEEKPVRLASNSYIRLKGKES